MARLKTVPVVKKEQTKRRLFTAYETEPQESVKEARVEIEDEEIKEREPEKMNDISQFHPSRPYERVVRIVADEYPRQPREIVKDIIPWTKRSRIVVSGYSLNGFNKPKEKSFRAMIDLAFYYIGTCEVYLCFRFNPTHFHGPRETEEEDLVVYKLNGETKEIRFVAWGYDLEWLLTYFPWMSTIPNKS